MNLTVPAVIPDNSNIAAAVQASGPVMWGTVALSLIVVATAFGNVLLCVAVMTEERLQNQTNYFLASLAVADLLVAVVVMPLAVVVHIYGISVPPFVSYVFNLTIVCIFARAVHGRVVRPSVRLSGVTLIV